MYCFVLPFKPISAANPGSFFPVVHIQSILNCLQSLHWSSILEAIIIFYRGCSGPCEGSSYNRSRWVLKWASTSPSFSSHGPHHLALGVIFEVDDCQPSTASIAFNIVAWYVLSLPKVFLQMPLYVWSKTIPHCTKCVLQTNLTRILIVSISIYFQKTGMYPSFTWTMPNKSISVLPIT